MGTCYYIESRFPLFNVRDITAPVMLIHSDMNGFNLNHYDMMFTALLEHKKEARFLRYAGEGLFMFLACWRGSR